MSRSKDEAYVPRTDLGFPDRRESSRFDLSFTDEMEIEDWERHERPEESAPLSRKRPGTVF